jgi:hypothetical protein
MGVCDVLACLRKDTCLRYCVLIIVRASVTETVCVCVCVCVCV